MMTAQRINRREAIRKVLLLGSSAFLSNACTRHRYVRPAAELDLGAVTELLYSTVHIRERAVLLNRDIDGWNALSTRCTYRGCDLTYQRPVLLCPCCRTRYSLNGKPHKGWPATEPLPWMEIYYKEGHLFANPAKPRPQTWRFTTPEIEEAIRELRRRVKEEGLTDELKIPDVLMGQGDGEVGAQFLEDDPNLLHDLEMIR